MAGDTPQPTEAQAQSAPSGKPPKIQLTDFEGGPKRTQAVRILLPEDDSKLEGIDDALVHIVEDVTDEPHTDQIEVLMYPGKSDLEISLHPTPTTIDERATQLPLDADGLQSYPPAVTRTVEAAREHLPETVGIEAGTLDLTPIGTTDVTTTRLLSTQNAPIAGSGKYAWSPLTRLFETCQRWYIPCLYGVILEKNSPKNDYEMTVRLATYQPAFNFDGDQGFAKLVETGHPLDLAELFSPHNLVSNHTGLTDGYWQTEYHEESDGQAEYSAEYNYRHASGETTKAEVKATADKLRQLTLGKIEHRQLLRGDSSWDPTYKKRNRSGRITIPPAQLNPFIELVPFQFDANPWQLVTGRSHPVFHTDVIVRSVAKTEAEDEEAETETAQDADEDTPQTPEIGPNRSIEGVRRHQQLLQLAQDWFAERGDEIAVVEQTSEPAPNALIRPDDGQLVALEKDVGSNAVAVMNESTAKPSRMLAAVERELERDRHVLLVYSAAKEAKRGSAIVSNPFRAHTEDGVCLYNKPDPVRCPDGRTPVYDRSQTLKWYTDGETLRLEAQGEGPLIAHGELDNDVDTFDFENDALEVHYYVEDEDEDSYRIETADGDTVAEYDSLESLTADWKRIREPHIPRDVSYRSDVTVMYIDQRTGDLKIHSGEHDFDAEALDLEFST